MEIDKCCKIQAYFLQGDTAILFFDQRAHCAAGLGIWACLPILCATAKKRCREKMLLYYIVIRRFSAAAGWHGKCSSLLNGRTGDLKLERSRCDHAAADYGRR
jgi:hypothetical protein